MASTKSQAYDHSSPKGFFKNRSLNNSYHTFMPSPLSRSSSPTSFSRSPSLSRSASRRSQTPRTAAAAASCLLRSMSRKNMDTIPAGGGSLSRNSSQKSSTTAFPPGSPSRSSSPNSKGLIKSQATEKNLECTLEELCFGCIKRIMIRRDVVTNNRQIVEEEEMLTIKVKPGWRAGTNITFEGMGNETPGTYPADVIFVISEKRHPFFRREGDNLELAVEIPLAKALTGGTLLVPLLGGQGTSFTIDIIQPGYNKIIAGQGTPKSKEQAISGNLIIKFLVEFPTELTNEQQANVCSILQDSC